jgi:ketosteroid isomerase-like protein
MPPIPGGRLLAAAARATAVVGAWLGDRVPSGATQSAAAPAGPASGDPYPTMRYVPSAVDDEWRYGNRISDGEASIVFRIAREATHHGRRVVQRDESNGDFRYQSVTPEDGLLVHRLACSDGRTIDYEPPARLLPASLRVGDRYVSESACVTREGETAVSRGRQIYEVSVEAVDDVDTPAGVFTGALRTRTIAWRTDADGTQQGSEQVEWLAPDVGPVRMTGRRYWNDGLGRRTRLFRLDAVLESARVGGRAWPAATSGSDAPAPDPARARGLALAHRAFSAFKDGLATGQWQAFLDMLAGDFTFTFPTGKYRGRHEGKATATEFFAYVSRVYPDGLFASLDRLTLDGTRAIYEFRSEGTLVLPNERRPYRNRVAVAMEFRGEQVAAYREYFGSDGTSY